MALSRRQAARFRLFTYGASALFFAFSYEKIGAGIVGSSLATTALLAVGEYIARTASKPLPEPGGQ